MSQISSTLHRNTNRAWDTQEGGGYFLWQEESWLVLVLSWISVFFSEKEETPPASSPQPRHQLMHTTLWSAINGPGWTGQLIGWNCPHRHWGEVSRAWCLMEENLELDFPILHRIYHAGYSHISWYKHDRYNILQCMCELTRFFIKTNFIHQCLLTFFTCIFRWKNIGQSYTPEIISYTSIISVSE